MRLATEIEKEDDVAVFNHKRVLVFRAGVLRLVRGAFDFCRGSFTGALHLLESMQGDGHRHPDFIHSRIDLTCAYVISSTALFFEKTELEHIEWPSNLISFPAINSFCESQEKMFKTRLCLRWGVEHSCSLCRDGFLLGCDGKHGPRRHGCGWPACEKEYIEELGIWIRKPCSKRAQIGSKYCGFHAGSQDEDNDDDSVFSTWKIVKHRGVRPAGKALIIDDQEPQYKIEVRPLDCGDGDTHSFWIPQSEIAPRLIREYHGELSTSDSSGGVKRMKTRMSFDSSEREPSAPTPVVEADIPFSEALAGETPMLEGNCRLDKR